MYEHQGFYILRTKNGELEDTEEQFAQFDKNWFGLEWWTVLIISLNVTGV